MKRFFSLALTVASLLAQQASFQGSMTIDGKAMPVRYACVYEDQFTFEEDEFFYLVVVLPEAPVSGVGKSCKAIEASFEERGKSSGLSALYLRMIPAKGQTGLAQVPWRDTSFYHAGRRFSLFAEHEGITQFTPKPGSAANTLAGRFHTKGTATAGGYPSFSLDLNLNLPVERPIRMKGAVAEKHPAVVALKQYLSAMAQGNLDQMQSLLTDEGRKNFQAELKVTNLKEVLPLMKQRAKYTLSMPDTAVIVEDEVASITLSKKEGSSKQKFEFEWIQQNGAWRHQYR